MSRIALDQVSKVFQGDVLAVDDVTLTIESGEFLVLVGPSGSGKSTLLRMIAGLEETSSGRIVVGEHDVTELRPRARDLAMVFQSYALYPHMTVRENLAFSLKMHRVSKDVTRERVNEIAEILGLEKLLDRRPTQLSGGQQQRVAIGRAMVREPTAFLMDEPLSNLDAKLRVAMRAELALLHKRLGITTVYVTHDQVEAMTLGQRVAVMRDGRVQQVDAPHVLYEQPVNLFVAAFIGTPPMNLVEGNVADGTVSFGGFQFPLSRDAIDACGSRHTVIVGIRPETFEDIAFAEPGLSEIQVAPLVVEKLGADAHVIFEIDAPRVEVDSVRAASDDEEQLLADTTRVVFTARVDPRSTARDGETMTLTIDTSRFQFFDVTSGKNLLHQPTRIPEPVA